MAGLPHHGRTGPHGKRNRGTAGIYLRIAPIACLDVRRRRKSGSRTPRRNRRAGEDMKPQAKPSRQRRRRHRSRGWGPATIMDVDGFALAPHARRGDRRGAAWRAAWPGRATPRMSRSRRRSTAPARAAPPDHGRAPHRPRRRRAEGDLRSRQPAARVRTRAGRRGAAARRVALCGWSWRGRPASVRSVACGCSRPPRS